MKIVIAALMAAMTTTAAHAQLDRLDCLELQVQAEVLQDASQALGGQARRMAESKDPLEDPELEVLRIEANLLVSGLATEWMSYKLELARLCGKRGP